MRFLLAALVLVIGLTAILQVTAFRQATIRNSVSIQIMQIDQAALALIPGEGSGNGVAPAALQNGMLRLDFRKGVSGIDSPASFGIAPARTYTYNKHTVNLAADDYEMRDVFRVLNNDPANCHAVSVWLSGSVPSDLNLAGIYGRTSSQVTPVALWTNLGGQTANRLTLTPGGGSMMVDFDWGTAPAPVSQNFEVSVSADQVSCL